VSPSLVLAATAPDVITFVVGAILIVAGALGVVLSRNPVHAALCLVGTLFGVAVLFVEQNAQFLAAVQVIVYAGAIVVLFLFVIMLLGVDRVERGGRDRIPAIKPVAAIAGLIVLTMVVLLARGRFRATGASSQGGSISGPGSNVGKLADSLFTQYVFAFEATALLLVIAVVGAVALSRRPGSESGENGTVELDEPISDVLSPETGEVLQ
jgi:NADH-quinone oxidoreductase subunit J